MLKNNAILFEIVRNVIVIKSTLIMNKTLKFELCLSDLTVLSMLNETVLKVRSANYKWSRSYGDLKRQSPTKQ